MKKINLFFILTLLLSIGSCSIESDIIFKTPEPPVEPEPPVDPGKPGIVIEIIEGVANVIAQYVYQDQSEFVRWEDGGVTYIVYNDKGEPAPYAKVKGLPAIANKEYVADSQGKFIVPKEDLPVGVDMKDRFGVTSEVTYVNSKGETLTEESAYNTYVPHKMDVKIEIINTPRINQNYTLTDIQVFRKVDHTSGWEVIPGYLGDLEQWVYLYELSDPSDVESFDKSSKKMAQQLVNISIQKTIYVIRPTKQSIYYTPEYQAQALGLWDEQDHYFNIQLDSYYGESPHAKASIQQAPIQFCPYIKNVTCKEYMSLGSNRAAVFSIWGEFITDDFDYDLIFEDEYVQEGYYYKPQIMDRTKANNDKMLEISFSEGSEGSAVDVVTTLLGSVDQPHFEILDRAIYTGSAMRISCVNYMFRNTGKMCMFTGTPATGFKISTEGYDPARYTAPRIDINYLP